MVGERQSQPELTRLKCMDKNLLCIQYLLLLPLQVKLLGSEPGLSPWTLLLLLHNLRGHLTPFHSLLVHWIHLPLFPLVTQLCFFGKMNLQFPWKHPLNFWISICSQSLCGLMACLHDQCDFKVITCGLAVIFS